MTDSNSLTDFEMADFLESLRSSAARHSKSLKAIEHRLGLDAGFVQGLMDEPDDWAFIIKTSVVIESALGQVLSESIISDGLERHIRALPMDGRIGKIQLAQDLGLIQSRSASRLRAICEIRNDFAHGLQVLKLSLSDYFGKMTSTDFEMLLQRFFSSDSVEPSPAPAKKPKTNNKMPDKNQRDGKIGKYLLWTCACVALLEFSELQRRIDSDKTWRNALITLGHAFLARQQGDETQARIHMREALDTLEAAASAHKHLASDSI